jgi:nitroimidazol reductase NimA-like FMN-containing flavoprotein (pyridoxamine 5'-phosphate oxidase superfamily)
MAPHKITEFLNEQATGVLSLTNDSRAYGIPISFAYDGEDRRAIMDLGFAEDSKKREFIDATEEVCLTVYEWNGTHDWTSVVVTGTFTQVDEADIGDDIVAWYHEVATDIDVSAGNVELEWYSLRAEDVSGVSLEG